MMLKFLLICFYLCLTNCSETITYRKIQTSNGPIYGNLTEKGSAFAAIPFAAPPIGDLRWVRPQQPTPWTTPLDATHFGPGCPQVCKLPEGGCSASYSEDCLFINVFTPLNSNEGSKKSVLVFFPGGRFEQGAAGVPLYNGLHDANATDIVIVTVGYRLGALGFLYLGPNLPGNFGLEDQIAGLKWVQKNIAAFGGNPNDVTIDGQSAGATSVAVHLVNPESQGLFHKAIIESNPWALYNRNNDTGLHMGKRFADDLDCDISDIGCLKSKSAQEVVDAQEKAQKDPTIKTPLGLFYPWTPMANGVEFTGQPLTDIANNNYNKVPIVIGTVKNEAILFIYQAWNHTLNEVEYVAALTLIFNLYTPKVLEQYPWTHGVDGRDLISTIGTDLLFACPARKIASVSTNNNPTYLYMFDHVPSFDFWGQEYYYCADVVCHGTELAFWWYTASFGGFKYSPKEQVLAKEMYTNWANFVKTGNPNGSNSKIQWPEYSSKDKTLLKYATPSTLETDYLDSKCDFWDSVGYFDTWQHQR